MPADSTGISDTDAKKIAEMVIKTRIEGSDKAISELGKMDKGFVGVMNSAKLAGNGIHTAFTSAISPLTKVAALVGAGLGFSQGIKAVEGYSKSIISLSAQMNKYGQGTGDAINKVEELSKTLSLTRAEAVGLASQFEKTFHTGNLNASAAILEKIKNVVGSNAEAIAKMSGELGAMTMKYPALQSAMEKLGSLDKERLRNHMLMMVTTGQMSQQEARGLQDFINQNKQISQQDQKKLDKHKEYVESMQELRTSFEEISLIIGKALMPMMTKFANLLKENMGTIKSVVGWIEKAVTFFLGWGKYIAIAVVGAKVMFGIIGGMLMTMKAIQSLSLLFPASGAAASAAAGKAAAASAASAHIAAQKACACSGSGGSSLNYGASPPGSPKTPGVPGVTGGGVAGLAGKASGAIMSVGIMYMAAEVASSFGGSIARAMGAEPGSTGEQVGNVAGNLLGGAAGGFAVGGPIGAAIGLGLGAVKSIWEIISGDIAAIRKLNEESMAERDKSLGAADTGLQKGELSRDTAHAKKHAAIYKDEENRGVDSIGEKYIADKLALETKNAFSRAPDKGSPEAKRREEEFKALDAKYKKDIAERQANPELVRKLESEDKLRGAKSGAMASVLYSNAMGTDADSRSNTKSTLKHSEKGIEEEMKKAGIKGSVSGLMGKYAKEGANLNVSQKLLNLLVERTKLEDSVSKATAYQAEMASIANMRYEVTLKLRQTESGILDVLLQKNLLYGNSISNTRKEQEQTVIVQKKLANEMLATVSRQQSVAAERATATKSLPEKEKELATSRIEAAEAKAELDNAREAARNTGDDPNTKTLAAASLSIASANHAAAVEKVKGFEKDILATKTSIVDSYEKERAYDLAKEKILIAIQETHYKIYDNAKKLLDITQQTTSAYGQLTGAISEQMQLQGTENPAVLNDAVVNSKKKLNEQLQRSIELQKKAEDLMSSGSKDELKANLRASITDKNAGDKSPAGQKKTEDEIKEMEAGVDNGTKQLELEKDVVDAKIRRATITKQLNEQDMLAVTLLDKKKSLAQAELGITEAYIGLMDQAGMGIGASVQMRMQAIGQTGKVLDQINSQIAKLQEQLADPNTDARQEKELKLKNLMQEQAQLLTKQWELSKALREGWASALTSQSIASGRVTKIMMTKQSNLATAIGEMGAAISSATGTNKKGQGARSSSRFGVDAAGNATFTDPGNSNYAQDYRGMGGEVDMATMKRITDMQSRGDTAGAASLYRQIGGQQQAARMSGSGTAYGAGVTGASAEFGPGSKPRAGAHGAVIPATSSTGGAGASSGAVASGGPGTPITLTFNVSTKAELDSLMKKIEEHLRKATSV